MPDPLTITATAVALMQLTFTLLKDSKEVSQKARQYVSWFREHLFSSDRRTQQALKKLEDDPSNEAARGAVQYALESAIEEKETLLQELQDAVQAVQAELQHQEKDRPAKVIQHIKNNKGTVIGIREGDTHFHLPVKKKSPKN